MSNTMNEFTLGSGFHFSGATINELGATEYTLVTIALDETGSIAGLEREIGDMLKAAIGACKKAPYANNLLVRVIRFGSHYARGGGNGVDEVHGFKPLTEVDENAYPTLRGGGGTPLYDAVFSAVGATNAYAKSLVDLDFLVNGITFVITDGGENASRAAGPKDVRNELAKSVSGEIMESHLSILIGIDTSESNSKDTLDALAREEKKAAVKAALDAFTRDAGMSSFIWAGDATEDTLAKIAAFVPRSISSTSQALGTGGPSKKISATI